MSVDLEAHGNTSEQVQVYSAGTESKQWWGRSMSEPQTELQDDTFQVLLEVNNHDSLLDLMDHIDDCDEPVTTKSILDADFTDQGTATIDLDVLTEKQRTTMQLALETGYYERPRQADLGDLSAELDISKSAVSQRLRSAETKLIKAAFEPFR